jgi:hypothetical protein
MPHAEATEALRQANIPPFHRWCGAYAHRIVLAHRVRYVSLWSLKPKMPRDAWLRLARGEWDATAIHRPNGQAVILIKHDLPSSRYIWSLVHELGHLVLGHPGGELDLQAGTFSSAPHWAEAEAHLFARHVLLPAEEMRTFLQWKTSAQEIARRKGVSLDAVLVRMQTMHRDGGFYEWLAA